MDYIFIKCLYTVPSPPISILPAPPAAPQITVSTASSDQFTLVLEPSSNATSYNVSVNDSVPISISVANYNVTPTNYNVSIGNSSIMLMSIPSNGGLSYMLNFSNRMNNTDYTVSVVAINCAGSSSPAIAKLPGRLSESFRVLKVLLAFGPISNVQRLLWVLVNSIDIIATL